MSPFHPSIDRHEFNMSRKILVTSALPYANGPIHLGHLVEYIQTDIWSRFQKMRGHECYYVCADDAHGTPIMLKARQEGITPEELVERIGKEHQQDFADFHIAFDNYHSTHSDENRELAELIFKRLQDNNHIRTAVVTRPYDPEAKMFLPDRYIKGTCPKCKAEDQYGDNCEVCGATYDPSELLDPHSVVSGAKPEDRETEHYFFKVSDFDAELKGWVTPEHLQEAVSNKLKEWLDDDLRDWEISRDAPYFGFEIPGSDNKFFYVWLDAPIGYMASFKNFCDKNPNVDFDSFFTPDSDAELHHFIGKDIVNFHGLFWPAMLTGAGFRRPTRLSVHGYLTVNGTKMSKSRGTFIKARTYLEHLNPEQLRYYFAAKLSDGVDDLDLNLDDFQQRINSDLVGKLVNLASRCAGFVVKQFDAKLDTKLDDEALWDDVVAAGKTIAEAYENRQFSKAMREIMALADKANQYIDQQKPWVAIKEESQKPQVHACCTMGINIFRVLVGYLKPVMPELAAQAEAFLNVENQQWHDLSTPLLGTEINKFKALMQRVDPKAVEAMVESSKDNLAAATAPAKADKKPEQKPGNEAIADTIQYDDFAKIDLRIAKIVDAQHVEKADKLLQLTLDIGEEQRNVFAGIKSAYDPADLVGKHTVMVANLAPRKMKFGMSEGMVLAAGPGGKDLWILEPHEGAQPGMRVK